jgi:rare lipoprotein A
VEAFDREAQRRKAVVQYLGQLPDEQVLDFYRVNQRATVLKTLHYEVLKQGSFLVNNQEVFRFRSGLGFLTPYLRAKQAAHRLQALLRNKATYLDVAVAQTPEGLYTINVGPSVVTTVDAKTAEYQGLQPQALAELWKQKLRVALGEKPPTAVATAVSNQVSGLAQSVQQQGVKLAEGMASWYGPGFHGRRCADGSRFDMHGLTAAHRTLPFGTKLRVVNMRTGKSCVVRVTDRGPFSGHRILDLSKGAAAAIGMLSSGVAKVRLERLP